MFQNYSKDKVQLCERLALGVPGHAAAWLVACVLARKNSKLHLRKTKVWVLFVCLCHSVVFITSSFGAAKTSISTLSLL